MNLIADLPQPIRTNEDFAWAPGRSSPVAGAPKLSKIMAAATELRPYLRERARQTEVDRRVSDEDLDRLVRSVVALRNIRPDGPNAPVTAGERA